MRSLGLIALLVSAGALATETWTVTLADLERPRASADWLAEPGLRPLMAALAEEEARQLVVRHPGGDRGSLQARWLAGQLVALGLPRSRIVLEPGGVAADRVQLRIRDDEHRPR